MVLPDLPAPCDFLWKSLVDCPHDAAPGVFQNPLAAFIFCIFARP
jgi:hypothetical protein